MKDPQIQFGWVSLFLLPYVVACSPDLDACSPHGGHGSAPNTVEVVLEAVPEAPPDALPPVVHLWIQATSGADALDPEAVVLVQGQVSGAHLGQLERNEVSNALRSRIVPAVRWRDEDGAVVLAPSASLELDADYALASGSPRFSIPLRTLTDDPLPLLERLWPPHGTSGSATSAVWCGTGLLPTLAPQAAQWMPSKLAGTLRRGAMPDGTGQRCVHFESPDVVTADAGPQAAPPLLVGVAPLGRLGPRPLVPGDTPSAARARACAPGRTSFGLGCARVLDDRVWVIPPEEPLLWSLHGPDTDVVRATRSANDAFVVASLPHSSAQSLWVQTLDVHGAIQGSSVAFTTTGPQAHVIINEVLANPVGPEPDQEWIELYNDGQVAADLAGWSIHDIGGETRLPSVLLGPGEYALLVNEAYDATSPHDTAPAPGSAIHRVAALGKGGLNNQGEPLLLYDADGIAVSAFSSHPKPKAGRGVYRVHPQAADTWPASFEIYDAGATPGTAN